MLSASATGRKASRVGVGKSDFLLALCCLGEDADRPKGERIVNGDLGDLEALGDFGEAVPGNVALASECMEASRFLPEPISELEERCRCTATGSAESTGGVGALMESETGFLSVVVATCCCCCCCCGGDVGGVELERRGDEATMFIRGGIEFL